MAGNPVPIPTTEEMKRMILCIEDLKQAASKKLPEGVKGKALLLYYMSAVEREID